MPIRIHFLEDVEVPGRDLKTTISPKWAWRSPPAPPRQSWKTAPGHQTWFWQKWLFLNPGRSSQKIVGNFEVGVRGAKLF